MSPPPSPAFRLAVATVPVTGDARRNGAAARAAMLQAAQVGARLVHLPEGALSGYAKNPIQDWAEVDWAVVRDELDRVARLAGELGLWVVLGSAHPLTPPRWPHNSLYVISDRGEVVDRYDKRILSHTEATRFYTPGSRAVVFEVDGYRFGCAICIEVNVPEVFGELGRLGVDCVLLSAYPLDAVFAVKARAHAAVECTWLSLAVPAEVSGFVGATVWGPDGEVVAGPPDAVGRPPTGPGDLVVADLDRGDPRLDVALRLARPWRAGVRADLDLAPVPVDDPRSHDRTCR